MRHTVYAPIIAFDLCSRQKAPSMRCYHFYAGAIWSASQFNPSKRLSRRLSFRKMSKVNAPDVDAALNADTYPDPQPEAEVQNQQDNSSKQKKQAGPPKKRDTHFLCFPLVTPTSIPQLADSLRHFRNVTTQPVRDGKKTNEGHKEPTPPRDKETDSQYQPPDESSNTSEVIQSNVNHDEPLPISNQELQLLPPIVHRPPGTFHLTLGVMDLSKKEEMDRALNLLQDLDYEKIFQQVLTIQDEPSQQYRSRRKDEAPEQQLESKEQPDQLEDKLPSLDRPISPPSASKTSRAPSQFSKDKLPQINLTGLSTFPAAKSSRVFYAKPSALQKSKFPLLQFGQAIRLKFREAGFITETRPLVLHATVANMRYATQAKGGRTSKGRTWRYGKDRWTEGQVDAREIIKCFDYCGGDVEEYSKGCAPADGKQHEFVWAKDIDLNTVAICKMGAENSDDEVLGKVYPPIGEKKIFT